MAFGFVVCFALDTQHWFWKVTGVEYGLFDLVVLFSLASTLAFSV